HAALDRGVNSLQPLWIQKPSAVPCQKHAISVHPWNCKITARSDGPRAITNHLPAIEQFCDVRMGLELLKLGVRIDQWIFVIETRHVPDIQDAVLHSVNPTASVGRGVGRKAESVCDAARRIQIVRQLLPHFTYDAPL